MSNLTARGWCGKFAVLDVPARLITLPTMTTPDENVVLDMWICSCCGYVYDPSDGDPAHGIPPGTPFEKLPEGWTCPLCLALKKAFERM